MTHLPTLQAVDTEMALIRQQLERTRADQTKLLEKESELRTKLDALEIKRKRLLDIEEARGS